MVKVKSVDFFLFFFYFCSASQSWWIWFSGSWKSFGFGEWILINRIRRQNILETPAFILLCLILVSLAPGQLVRRRCVTVTKYIVYTYLLYI